jgi:hypothetical protein
MLLMAIYTGSDQPPRCVQGRQFGQHKSAPATKLIKTVTNMLCATDFVTDFKIYTSCNSIMLRPLLTDLFVSSNYL